MADFFGKAFGSGGGFDLAMIGEKFYFIGRAVFWIALVIVGSVAFYRLVIQFKIKVRIYVESGGKIVDIKDDRAKILRDKQGKHKLVFFKNRKSAPVPELKYKFKKGKADYYEFSQDSDGQLHPCMMGRLDPKDPFIQPVPQDRKVWARLEEKLLIEKFHKKSFMEQWMPSVVMMMSFALSFLILFFLFKELGGSINSLAAQFGQVASNCLKN